MRRATVALVFVVLFSAMVFADDVPRIMNYQGKLTDASGVALDGTYSITFRIYDDSTGGNLLWYETKTVNVVNGLFDVELDLSINGGDTLKFDRPYWITLEVESDGEMTPREKLAPVSFAFRSIYADTADYVEGGAGDNDWVVSGDGTVPDTVYNLSDYIAIGTTNPDPSAALDITSTDRGLLIPRMTTAQRDAIDLTGNPNAVVIFNTTIRCFEFYYDGTWYNIACACTPPGIPIATEATGVTDSQFTANWNAATGATGYYLDVSEESDFSSFVPGYGNLDVGNVTSYDVTGLSAGTTYYYRVRAYNDCGTSGNSNVISVTTNPPPPFPGCVTIGGPNYDRSRSIIQTSDGGYAIVGETYSFGEGSGDVYVIKLDSLGSLIWTKTIGGPDYDRGYSIIQTSDGGYAIVGETKSYGAGDWDVYVIKLDSLGNLIWTKTIGSPDAEYGNDIIQTSDGGYAIVGRADWDACVIKLDSLGNLIWAKTVRAGSWSHGHSIIQTSDGGYAIVGEVWWSSSRESDVYVIKLDGSGNLIWLKSIGTSDEEFGRDIIQVSDGGYVIVGTTYNYNVNVYVVRLDASGNLYWTKSINGEDDDYGYSVIQDSNGDYVIAGYTESFGAGGFDVYVIKLDPAGSGNLTWTRTIGGTGDDYGFSVIQNSNGDYVIVGWTESFGAGNADVYFVALDGDGTACTPNCGSGEGGVLVSITSSTDSGGTLDSPSISISSPGASTDSGGTLTIQCP